MSNLQWTAAVFGVFLVASLTLWRKAWKDMRGAMLIALAIVVLGALTLVSGCAVSPEYRPWMEAGVAYDRSHAVGEQPTCVVRIRQPLVSGKIVASVTHHSSCPMQNDAGEVNQLEVTAILPLGRSK